MDALLNDLVDQAKSRFEGKIDFNGQKQAERYLQVLLISFGVIAFLVGFTLQNLLLTFGIFAGGLLVSLLVSTVRLPPAKADLSHSGDRTGMADVQSASDLMAALARGGDQEDSIARADQASGRKDWAC
ncbi:uncharacterized protein L969DRAFT_92978 [Mixia osmundae IAM 14324]|uniref:Signal peptidase complex subunit 1 n=1 Tax=Mixia osmundae (strain CBS 9802 / IAM 14324 / JCM 22182 / KY 12970) TaxID=764103 RepID=G7DTY6_MIXOS|nr:uncharacterized protein L969DRAFT_92978 [Mixia osmundae IAM 14324]KEI41760.1 hypothetical protein L969DRAFT_92978 [Mixia osmundae IAM 14324]GAA94046.1 hypothetical protein E5Q_00693 [Mixia osmundae IAM 14324]